NYTFKKIRALAQKSKFSLSTPIKDIPKKELNIILYGSEDEPFEGVVNTINRSFRDSGSDKLRKWAENFMINVKCPTCEGMRLKIESLHFKLNGINISELAAKDVGEMVQWFDTIESKLNKIQKLIAYDLLKEIRSRLGFLMDVGLDYISLDRPSRTLSGGEAQRIRLATQIGSQLVGITYILDEPSIGLHQRDNQRLIQSLRSLTKAGNSVLVVEHDKDIMLDSDYLIDLGPGAGKHGGEIVSQGKPKEFKKLRGNTADYLANRVRIEIPEERRKGNGKYLALKGATGNNLKQVDIKIPLGTLVCVTGVSGSGKSTLINETLYPILRQHFHNSHKKPLPYKKIIGIDLLDKVIDIDQSPIGRTPRSNPATYIGVFSEIRNLFTKLPESQIRGYKPGRFSFNVKGGRCEHCEGAGKRLIEMNFLPDVHVLCEKCFGKRYNRETLEIRYKARSIADVLHMTVDEACLFFEKIPKIYRKVRTLQEVGLGYITLGQSATTLSGGEAQRVKLSSELSKRDTGSTLYILDEPTTGLHFHDIKLLMKVIERLVDKGNTVIIIEHNMDVIKLADHIIDVGLEGGSKGGRILFEGKPENLIKVKTSHTAKFLAQEFK
ncbi:UNVERIFIED_CONTAM: hypothetical protein GTU68_029469, partial [Idotea baltica]|nr:hypothetical protein [Idotea baltica]